MGNSEQKEQSQTNFEAEAKELAFMLVQQQKQTSKLLGSYRELLSGVAGALDIEKVDNVQQLVDAINELKKDK